MDAGGFQCLTSAHSDSRRHFRAVLVQPACAIDPSLEHRAIESVLEILRAQRRHGFDDFKPAEIGRVAHGRSPVAVMYRDVQKLGIGLDKLDCRVAIVSADCSFQCVRRRIRLDSLLQYVPVAEGVFACDDQLSIVQSKGSCGECRIVGLGKSRMAVPYSLKCLAIALTPQVEKFACFALWDVKMGPLRQPPGYCSHNLSSSNAPVVRSRRAGSQVK